MGKYFIYIFSFNWHAGFIFKENCLKKDAVSHWTFYFLSLTIDTNDMIPEYLIEKLEKILLIQELSNECGMGVNKNDRKKINNTNTIWKTKCHSVINTYTAGGPQDITTCTHMCTCTHTCSQACKHILLYSGCFSLVD